MHTQKTSECAICQSIQPEKKSVMAKLLQNMKHKVAPCLMFSLSAPNQRGYCLLVKNCPWNRQNDQFRRVSLEISKMIIIDTAHYRRIALEMGKMIIIKEFPLKQAK
jgi:hypothetical protein